VEEEDDVVAGVAVGTVVTSVLVVLASLEELASLVALDDSFAVDFDPRLSFL
jgi:hypothetical protein